MNLITIWQELAKVEMTLNDLLNEYDNMQEALIAEQIMGENGN